jgi:hypothetical protein
MITDPDRYIARGAACRSTSVLPHLPDRARDPGPRRQGRLLSESSTPAAALHDIA